ncbi:hypothetical protein AAG570_012731 [Ranatra chinensis]|uniref:Uncharacterized protein n=1 Tax=Ranatra chinensis TaxID=642074 RepID=A0ABD0YTD9_9HEMI
MPRHSPIRWPSPPVSNRPVSRDRPGTRRPFYDSGDHNYQYHQFVPSGYDRGPNRRRRSFNSPHSDNNFPPKRYRTASSQGFRGFNPSRRFVPDWSGSAVPPGRHRRSAVTPERRSPPPYPYWADSPHTFTSELSFPNPPVISPPVISPPVISPPVISPPVISPPVTSPPVTSPPVPSPPVPNPPVPNPPVPKPYPYWTDSPHTFFTSEPHVPKPPLPDYPDSPDPETPAPKTPIIDSPYSPDPDPTVSISPHSSSTISNYIASCSTVPFSPASQSITTESTSSESPFSRSQNNVKNYRCLQCPLHCPISERYVSFLKLSSKFTVPADILWYLVMIKTQRINF